MLVLLAVAALTVAPQSATAAPARCKPVTDQAAARGPARVRPLAEMPPAQQIKTVWRFDERGCPELVVVRSRVGADGR